MSNERRRQAHLPGLHDDERTMTLRPVLLSLLVSVLAGCGPPPETESLRDAEVTRGLRALEGIVQSNDYDVVRPRELSVGAYIVPAGRTVGEFTDYRQVTIEGSSYYVAGRELTQRERAERRHNERTEQGVVDAMARR